MLQTVCESQETVCEMHIFNKDRGVFKTEIAVTEIPEGTDTECHKALRDAR